MNMEHKNKIKHSIRHNNFFELIELTQCFRKTGAHRLINLNDIIRQRSA